MESLKLDKECIVKILDDFSQEVVLEDFIDRIILTAKIERAREQIKNGQYLTEEEFDEETKSW